MESFSVTLWEAVVVALGGMLAVGVVSIIRLLIGIAHDMRYLVPSVKTLYTIQPYLGKALRHQNSALRELGANGSTERSNECLDDVDRILNEKLASSAVGKCKA